MKREFKLTFKSYFSAVKNSFFHPQQYANLVEQLSLKTAVFYLLVNLIIATLIQLIYRSIIFKNPVLLITALSETIFIMPFAIVVFLVVGVFLFILAKMLGGKASIGKTLTATAYSSAPLILFNIPLLGFFSFLWSAYLTALTFRRIHDYSKIKAAINIALPVFLSLLFSVMLGIAKSLIFSSI